MPQVTIGDVAYRIGSSDQPYALQNNGITDIYLGTGPNVSPLQYDRLLDVGGELSWPSGQELFAVVDKLLTGQLTYVNNGAQGTSGATRVSGVVNVTGDVKLTGPVTIAGTVPISGTVGISGPVAIQGTVPISGNVNISGPVDVAGDINITNAELQVGGSVATKVRTLQLLDSTFNPGLTFPQTILNTGLAAGYQSIVISLTNPALQNANLDGYLVTVQWSTATRVVHSETFAYGTRGYCEYITSVKADNLQITVETQAGAAASITQRALIIATSAILEPYYYQEPGFSNRYAGVGAVTFYSTGPKSVVAKFDSSVVGNASQFLSGPAGKARVTLVKNGGAVLNFAMRPMINSGDRAPILYVPDLGAGVTVQTYEIVTDLNPFRMGFVFNSAIPTSVEMTIVWE